MSATKTVNRLGLSIGDYKGVPSTLCSGCGHDSITNKIIKACYQLDVDPYKMVKFSGIGCSSKTPAYFLSRSAGFNSLHGRMPSVATGALLANQSFQALGISGDGDTANIGLGQFMHCIRRNVPLVYVIENNGVYGLTKGQFSATADLGSKAKSGEINPFPAIDTCRLAIELGCGYVARSFAGDPKQLIPLLEGALCHRGTALLDVISPCVAFNNHEGSTKSYDYGKEHNLILNEVGFVPHHEPLPDIDQEPGTVKEFQLPDGSYLMVRKLGMDYDPGDKKQALQILDRCEETLEMVTGLLYVNTDKPAFQDTLHLVDEPLFDLPEERVRPTREVLDEIMEAHR